MSHDPVPPSLPPVPRAPGLHPVPKTQRRSVRCNHHTAACGENGFCKKHLHRLVRTSDGQTIKRHGRPGGRAALGSRALSVLPGSDQPVGARVIPDFAVRQALAALHPGSQVASTSPRGRRRRRGGVSAPASATSGSRLTAAQRSAAATRIAPAHDAAARLRALQILLLVGSPAARDTVEARA